jgi:hypothetical protein
LLYNLSEVFPGWEIPVYTYFNALCFEATYLYDYGDHWMHRVKLEGYMNKDKFFGVCVLFEIGAAAKIN